MNNDVIPDEGQGYLVCEVIHSGHIMREGRLCVHRETRNLGSVDGCYRAFDDAKGVAMARGGTHIVLELSPEGGGRTIWIHPDALETVRERLLIWKGCYGLWPYYTYKP